MKLALIECRINKARDSLGDVARKLTVGLVANQKAKFLCFIRRCMHYISMLTEVEWPASAN